MEAREGATTTVGLVLEEISGSLKFMSRCRQESAEEEKKIWVVRSCVNSQLSLDFAELQSS